MDRLKPEVIPSIRIGGVIDEVVKNKYFTFRFRPKSRDLKCELEKNQPRYQILENKRHTCFDSAVLVKGMYVTLAYLTDESMKGLYKDPEMNLPYEVLSTAGGKTIYRQSIIDTKEEIYNRLEQAAIDEGLRK